MVPYTQKGGQGLDYRKNRNDQKDEKQGMKCKVDGDNLFPLNARKFLHLSSVKTHYTTEHLTKCRLESVLLTISLPNHFSF